MINTIKKYKRKHAFIDLDKGQNVWCWHDCENGQIVVYDNPEFSGESYIAELSDLKELHQKRSQSINKVSETKKKEDKIYLTLRKVFLSNHPICEAKILGCVNQATEVHHKKGRVGKNYLDVHTFLALCNNCHRWIETHPEWAKEHGYSLDRL